MTWIQRCAWSAVVLVAGCSTKPRNAPVTSEAARTAAPQRAAPIADATPLPAYRGVLSAKVQERVKRAAGAEAVGEEDGRVRVTSPHCSKAATRAIAEEAGPELVQAGYYRLICMRREGDIDLEPLLSYAGVKRYHAAREIEKRLREKGEDLGEVTLTGRDGTGLVLVSRQCSDRFLARVFAPEGRRILRDEGRFELVRCEGGPEPVAFRLDRP